MDNSLGFQKSLRTLATSLKFNFTLKRLVSILRITMLCLGTFPMPKSYNMKIMIFYRLLWWFYLINILLIIFPTAHTIVTFFHDLSTCTHACMTLAAMLDAITILIHFKLQESRLEVLFKKKKFDVKKLATLSFLL